MVRRWWAVAGALSATVVIVFGLGASGAGAQGSGERVRSFAIDVVIAPDGSATFRETIEYDFGTNDRHGIERYLRTRMGYDHEHDRRYPLQVLDVTAVGASARYTVTAMGGGLERIRVGDPDRTVRGVHTYTLTYRLGGVVNAQPGDDELYWNMVGDGWSVPIDDVDVRVRSSAVATKVACFAGPVGSRASCDRAAIDAGVASFGQMALGPNEDLTVVVAIADGDGDEPDREPQPILVAQGDGAARTFGDMFATTPVTVGLTAFLAAAFAAAIAPLQFFVGRDRRAVGSVVDATFSDALGAGEPVPLFDRTATPVEFVPPENLRPAQLVVLHDETATNRAVSATIVDLAVRGWLRIEEVTSGRRNKVTDYRLVSLRLATERGALLAYERHLLDKLFEDGEVVLLSDLKNQFASALSKTKSLLYEDAVANGWFLTRPDRVRLLWALGGSFLLTAGIGLTVLLAAKTSFGLVGLPVAVAGLAVLIGARWMPRRTPKGTGLLRRVNGFEELIRTSEAHRAAFAERKHLFTEYLPYAVAFGATKKWAATFAGLGDTPPDTSRWYVGSAPLAWGSFGDNLEGFSSQAGSTMASTPGSSGGSGFGGSSGGGGGGGGGGSW